MAEMDRLTGLPDRSEFAESLATFVSDERAVLVVFDVDDLRVLNDRHGHYANDRLLARLGSLIQERCGPGELAARIGGDHFALMLFEDDVSEVVRDVERIRGRFAEESDGATLSVGIAAGARVVHAWADGSSLLLAADQALAEAKKERPGGLKIFRPPI